VLLDGIDLPKVERALEDGVDHVFAPPTVLAKLTRAFQGRHFPKVRVLFCGTSTLTPALYAKARDMFGPVVRFPNPTHITPFVHLLGGGVHTSAEAQGASSTDTNAAWAVGGGIDLSLGPLFSIRPAQVDYLQTRIGGDSQNNFRYSAGVVLKF